MKATIVVNRHVAAANKKHGQNEPAISVQTSRGVIRCYQVQLTGTITVIQNTDHPLACGATIWMETDQIEKCTIDDRPAQELLDELKSKKRGVAAPKLKDKHSTTVESLSLFHE